MQLYYFKPSEFGEWYTMMSPRLLVLLDTLRHQWGKPIRISLPDGGGLGRYMGDSLSQHNVARWGEVRAADVIPEGINDAYDARVFVDIADRLGFTGIGIYPEWNSGIGFHLDVRVDASPGSPALWGGVRNSVGQQRYVTFSDAMGSLP